MSLIKLINKNQQTLYTGQHKTLSEAIESAITKNIQLDGIDLTHANIPHINLDGVKLDGASFYGANLMGANMSESRFTNCDFSYSNMTSACLCYNDIINCNFKYTKFHESDISMSCFDFCAFEGFSTFEIPFYTAFRIQKLTFVHHEKPIPFETSPILIKSGKRQMAIIGNHMIFNDIPHTFDHLSPPESMEIIPLLKIQSMVDLMKKFV